MRQLLIDVLALAVLWRMWCRNNDQLYVCPQCGSTNGDHAEGCTWNG